MYFKLESAFYFSVTLVYLYIDILPPLSPRRVEGQNKSVGIGLRKALRVRSSMIF